MSNNCYKCNAELEFESIENIARSESCPKCLTSIRCCSMCNFYDNNSYNECRESSAERIVDKEKPNFCDFFKIRNGKSVKEETNDALAKANSLFKI